MNTGLVLNIIKVVLFIEIVMALGIAGVYVVMSIARMFKYRRFTHGYHRDMVSKDRNGGGRRGNR